MPQANRMRACSVCRATFTRTRPDQTRCGAHDAPAQAAKRARRPYDHAERLEHAAMIAAHVAVAGWTCPGDADHPAHPVPPGRLTVDHHAQPVVYGGRRATGGAGKRVICARANQAAGGSIGGRRRSRP